MPRRPIAATIAASRAAARAAGSPDRPAVMDGGALGGVSGLPAGDTAGAGDGEAAAGLAIGAGLAASRPTRRTPVIPSRLLQPIAVLQLPGQVLLGDEADAA